ncbi:hypothetical protein HV012_10895 [Escherichia fergusonii]|nr:hypothetical protein HV012_10895 [Escherichia fergusonii]QMB10442.1 hypothetical protein HV010_10890 [Escherichia fergusonii]
MTALPDLPPSLTTLDISGNQLTRLPSLPASLQGQDAERSPHNFPKA